MSGHETWNTLLYTLHMVSPVPRYSLITESTTRNVHSGYWHANAFQLLMLLLQSSLVPRLIAWGKVEPGTHCSRMRKNLRKRVSKRIR